MDYLTLLAATVRLIDLHDSDRGYGESPNFTRESRTGQEDGIYLDIAMIVIECLKKLDETAHQEYSPFSAILRSVRGVRPDANDSDVLYVINVLRRPTELFYLARLLEPPTPVRQSEKRKTAIIEKTDYADEYRLSPTGRMLPLLVNAAHDATYLRGDAYNLLHAIEHGDFQRVTIFAEEIVGQLRNEILDIRSALEKVGKTETIEKYISHFAQWRKVIDETIRIVQSAEEQLDSKTLLDTFEGWLERCSVDITFESLRNSVLRVRQVLAIFNRLLSELVHAASQDKRIGISPPSFQDFACALVRAPFSPNAEKLFLGQWGAIKLKAPFHSVLDGLGAVRIRSRLENASPLQFSDEVIEPISRLGKLQLMEKHGQEISQLLRQGPMRLSDAIDRGLFMVDERTMLGDLVGVFVAPDALLVDREIEIRVSPSLVTRTVGSGVFLFSDLEISIAEVSHE